jgi:ubiquinone/menaquinone biosynthesis C-methylase UbiE
VPDHDAIYARHAERYDLLVSREDHPGNLLPAILRTAPFTDRAVVELGAGTGRLTRLLAPAAKIVFAFDRSPHMLSVASRKLGESGLTNCRLAVCDHRSLPAGRGIADTAVAGAGADPPRVHRRLVDRGPVTGG